MSVLKSKRGESAMQFIETARELEIYTIKQCAKFPKRFMFLITKDLRQNDNRGYKNIVYILERTLETLQRVAHLDKYRCTI